MHCCNHSMCKHLNLKYCPHCDLVYCRTCGREWTTFVWNYSQSPFWTYTVTSGANTAGVNTKCEHQEDSGC